MAFLLGLYQSHHKEKKMNMGIRNYQVVYKFLQKSYSAIGYQIN